MEKNVEGTSLMDVGWGIDMIEAAHLWGFKQQLHCTPPLARARLIYK